MCVSFVGALNVGSIVLNFDENLKTNQAEPSAPYFQTKHFATEKRDQLLDYF